MKVRNLYKRRPRAVIRYPHTLTFMWKFPADTGWTVSAIGLKLPSFRSRVSSSYYNSIAMAKLEEFAKAKNLPLSVSAISLTLGKPIKEEWVHKDVQV